MDFSGCFCSDNIFVRIYTLCFWQKKCSLFKQFITVTNTNARSNAKDELALFSDCWRLHYGMWRLRCGETITQHTVTYCITGHWVWHEIDFLTAFYSAHFIPLWNMITWPANTACPPSSTNTMYWRQGAREYWRSFIKKTSQGMW